MKITAYKGFDKNWKCRDFQYEVGKTYTHKGKISLCNSGFHACEAPLDTWNYYSPTDDSQYAIVELGEANDEKENDTKRVGKSITVKASVSLGDLIKAQVEWVSAHAEKGKNKSSGDGSKAASSGDGSKAASSGYGSTAASSGNYSTAASSGNYSTAASSGYGSTAASSGDGSTAASSGDYSTAASSGYGSTAASSGNYSTAASSGNYSKAASSGNYSTAASSGNKTISMVAGINGKVKSGPDGCFALAYWDKKGDRPRIAVGHVGENGIKPDTWYLCDENGNIVERK